VARIIPQYGFILKLHKEFYKGGWGEGLKEYFFEKKFPLFSNQ
jgi:hypothetical protein